MHRAADIPKGSTPPITRLPPYRVAYGWGHGARARSNESAGLYSVWREVWIAVFLDARVLYILL